MNSIEKIKIMSFNEGINCVAKYESDNLRIDEYQQLVDFYSKRAFRVYLVKKMIEVRKKESTVGHSL